MQLNSHSLYEIEHGYEWHALGGCLLGERGLEFVKASSQGLAEDQTLQCHLSAVSVLTMLDLGSLFLLQNNL